MPPKTKADTATATAPATSASLCDICEPVNLDPSTTVFGCEHGIWTFKEPGDPALPVGASPEEQLATLLSNLDAETLQKLLDAKTAASVPVEPVKADTPATKATPAAAK